jgi:hypothetical protein
MFKAIPSEFANKEVQENLVELCYWLIIKMQGKIVTSKQLMEI